MKTQIVKAIPVHPRTAVPFGEHRLDDVLKEVIAGKIIAVTPDEGIPGAVLASLFYNRASRVGLSIYARVRLNVVYVSKMDFLAILKKTARKQ